MSIPKWAAHKVYNKYIVNDVTVLNKLSTGSGHRMVRAKVIINVSKEEHTLIRNVSNTPWACPSDVTGFQ